MVGVVAAGVVAAGVVAAGVVAAGVVTAGVVAAGVVVATGSPQLIKTKLTASSKISGIGNNFFTSYLL
jgi:hypothetical protein